MTVRPPRTRTTRLLAPAALAAALLLTACGGDDASSEDVSGIQSESATSSAEAPGAAGEVDPEHNDADVMFAQMMLPHHRQAIEMSDVLLAKADVDEDVVALAEQIKAAQDPEIEEMTAFLEGWGEEVPADDMQGMNHDMGDGGMSGMMSPEQMQQLEEANGPEAARLFLEQMIEHHTGAVEMAQKQLDAGQNPQALELAQTIVDSQQTEITQMQELLATGVS